MLAFQIRRAVSYLAARLDDLPVEIILERFYERGDDGDVIAPPEPRHVHVPAHPLSDHKPWAEISISAARSPMTTQGAMVLLAVTRGMIDPSAIRTLSMPYALRR
jgi:hypothetical protein